MAKRKLRHPVLAVFFVLFLVFFFGGGLLLLIDAFWPFLPMGVLAPLSLSLFAIVVVGMVAGKCIRVVTALRRHTKTGSAGDPNALLIKACEKGDRRGAIAALKAGANPNTPNVRSNLAHKQGTALMRAARHGHIEVVRALLKRGAGVNRCDDSFSGETPLHAVAVGGHLDVAQLLLDCGAKLDAADTYGKTALHAAATQGQYDVVRFLVNAGANVRARNFVGNTPLDSALISGTPEIVEFLRQQE